MNPFKKAIQALLRRVFGPLFFALLLATASTGCEKATAPSPYPPQATCNVTISGQSVVVTGPICGGGDGSVTQPSPSASPSATPGTSKCEKRNEIYSVNVVNAWRSLAIPEKTLAGHLPAMVAALKAMQFEATSGGLLAPDEIAVKVRGGAFSETYDLWLGDLTLENKAQVLYVATCTPASF